LGGAGRALATPPFRLYFIGYTLTTIGRWMKRTAVGWLVWQLTESPTWLGIIAFADLLPTVLLAIVAGAISDRFGIMRIMRLSQVLSAILSVLFGALILSGWINIYLVLVLTLIFGAVESMGQPARMSAVHAVVAQRDLSSAIGLTSASFNASRIIGPGIAGALILWTDTGVVIGLSALTFLSFYLVLLKLDFGTPKSDGMRSPMALLQDIRSGIAYAFGHSGLRFVFILLAATSFLIRPVIELMPGIAAQVFDGGPTGLSLLLAAIGAGAIAASLWLAQRGETKGLTRLLVLSTSVTGIALMLAMQFRHIWLAAAFLVIMGAAMLVGNVAAQTLVQNTVASELRARVMSLFIVFAYGLPAIGAIIMGWVASYAGFPAAIGGGALFMLLFWLWARKKQRARGVILETQDKA
jgi:MFS family permease